MNNLHITKTGSVVGIISVAFFVICAAWGIVLIEPTLKELHVNILRIAYPGFSMSFVGVMIGIVEAFIYGWLLGALFAWLCKIVCVSDDSKS